MFISLPETSSANILLRRARRLRNATGNANLQSQSEIDQQNMSATEVAYDALIKPWQINFLDPAVVSMSSTRRRILLHPMLYIILLI
jgi:DHA1 family multidrug resistance protein-like MFS transporter